MMARILPRGIYYDDNSEKIALKGTQECVEKQETRVREINIR
jgi:hypothetical protein